MPDVIEWRLQTNGELAARASDGCTYPTTHDRHGLITIGRRPLPSVLCTDELPRSKWPRPNHTRWEPATPADEGAANVG